MTKLSKVASVVAIAVFIGLIVTIIACGFGRSKEIRIGFNTWVGYGPLYVAEEKGFFSKRGLQVRLERIESTGQRRAAVVARRLEGEGSTIDDLVLGASEGVPGKMVLALDESVGADGILANADIKSVADLKGKTVAVQPGFVNNFFLLYVLDKNGLSAKDIQIKPMEPDAASAAFAARQVDVAVTWEPHLSQVQKIRQDGRLLLTTRDYRGIIVDTLVFRDDFIANDRGKVEGFVAAWFEALAFLKAHPEEGWQIIARKMDLKPEQVSDMLSGVKLLGREENVSYLDRKREPNAFEVAQIATRLWYEQGYIKTKPDVAKLIDTSFAQSTQ
jgi:NitT/TauT family transport system substrate-binding protein